EDGYKLLFELGAMNDKRKVTPIGKNLLKFQVDPKLARMILEAKHNHCINDLLIITSFLSIQDPRERPTKFQQKADQAHKANYDKFSDFLSILNLWRVYQQQMQKLNANQLKRYCRDKFLSHNKMREWIDIYKQLKVSAKTLNYQENSEPATYDQIHKSILAGLLANIGFNYELKEYIGARGLKFYIFPGSSQFKPTPKWILASELIETTKLYARNVAKIQPEWIEILASHVTKKNYSNPHWSKKHNNVMAYEKVTLYGLELVAKRLTPYVKIDPVLSREIFIRGALVAGDFTTEADFFADNLLLLDEVEDLEHKSRRRDIMVDDETLFDYYDEVIDQDVFNKVTFEQWYKKLNKSQKDKLFFQKSDLMQHSAKAVTQSQFPETLTHQGLHLPLEYHFEPGHKNDGVTIKIPLMVLNQINPLMLDWLVPGMIKDKIIALMRALPKSIRKYCVPIPQYADAVLDSITYDTKQNLKAILVTEIIRITGIVFNENIWDEIILDQHMHMNIQVLDEKGEMIASNRDLRSLQLKLESKANMQVIQNKKQQDIIYTSWNFFDLEIENKIEQYGININVYPCLKCLDQGVIVSQETTIDKAESSHRKALFKLLHIHCSDKFKNLKCTVPNYDKISMLCLLLYQKKSWEDDFIYSVILKTFILPSKRILSKNEYDLALSSQLENLQPNILKQASSVFKILGEYQELKKSFKQRSIPLDLINLYNSINVMLDSLVYVRFLSETPSIWLERIPLYIKALKNRLEKAPRKLIADREFILDLECIEQKLNAKIKSKHLNILDSSIIHITWMCKELWVSQYAQEIKTQHPVSVVKLEKLISNL
ncbi:MAG: ATP-dependent helicase HrpA, partial [Francisellaceae bacterium]